MLVASTISTAHARVARAAITMIDTPGDSRSAFFSRAANLALLFRTARYRVLAMRVKTRTAQESVETAVITTTDPAIQI
jgi:hypothetical protein